MDSKTGERRKSPRFNVFLKAMAEQISQFAGCLEDISEHGCKVRFPGADDFDMDGEYAMTVYPQINSGFSDFNVVVKPCWLKRMRDETVIGFSILHSPGYKQFLKYVTTFVENHTASEE